MSTKSTDSFGKYFFRTYVYILLHVVQFGLGWIAEGYFEGCGVWNFLRSTLRTPASLARFDRSPSVCSP